MGTKHSEAVGSVNHAITAATYADIAARDADTDFQVTVNIDKTVRVDSPLSYFVMTGIGPVAWTEFGSDHPNETLAEVLATGNTSGGTDLVISTGDVATLTDAPVAGTDAANKDYVDAQVGTVDTLAEILATGNTSGGTDLVISAGDVATLTDAPTAGTDAANKDYVDGGAFYLSEGTIDMAPDGGRNVELLNSDQGGLRFATDIISGQRTIFFQDNAEINLVYSNSNTATEHRIDLTALGAIITDATIDNLTVDTLNANSANVGNIVLDHEDVNSLTFLDDGSIQVAAAVPGGRPLQAQTLDFVLATDVSAEITSARGLWMSADGLKAYIGDNTTQAAYEYSMTFPFDTSTLVYSGNSLGTSANFTEFFLKPDGTIAYFMTFGGQFRYYTLSTPFDLSSAGSLTMFNSGVGSTSSFSVIDNGFNAYFTENSTNTILEWEMTTTWDITTLVDTGRSFAPTEITNNLSDMYISPDGREIFLIETVTALVYQYRLTTPTDISTAVFVRSAAVNNVYEEFCVSFNQRKAFGLWVTTNDELHEYDLGYASDGLSVFDTIQSTHGTIDGVTFADGSDQSAGATENATTHHFDGNIQNGSFDADTELTANVLGFGMRDDGSQMFVAGNAAFLFRYELSVPWDVTTAVYTSNTATLLQSIQDVCLTNDGMALLTIATDATVRRWDMTTAYDLTTVAGTATATVTLTEPGSVTSFFCSKDGKRFFTLDDSGDIFQYDFLDQFDPDSLVYTGNTFNNGSASSTQAIWMKDDGKILYIRINAGMREYILIEPWNVSTAILDRTTALDGGDTLGRCYVIKSDGSRMFMSTTEGTGFGFIKQYDLGLITTSLVTGDLTATDIVTDRFLSNATEFSDGSQQATAGNPTVMEGRIASAQFKHFTSISSQTSSASGLYIREDGRRLYTAGFSEVTIEQYTLSTPWDVTTKSHNNSLSVVGQIPSLGPSGIAFKDDGLVMYVSSAQGSDELFQYTLSTAWDISTASYSGISLDVSTEGLIPGSMVFTPNGENFFILSLGNDEIYKYDCPIAWDLDGASYSGISFNPTELTDLDSMFIRADGRFLYAVTDSSADQIHEYRLTTPWDIETAEDTGHSHGASVSDVFGISINTTLDKLIISSKNHLREYNLGIATEKAIIGTGNITTANITDLTTTNIPTLAGQFASRAPVDTIEVFQASDLEDLATANVITVAVNTGVFMKANVSTATRFNVTSGAVLTFHRAEGGSYIYTDSGTLLTASNGNIIVIGTDLIATGGGTLFNVEGSAANFVGLAQFSTVGWNWGSISRISTSTAGPGFFPINLTLIDWAAGITLTDIGAVTSSLVRLIPFAGSGDSFFKIEGLLSDNVSIGGTAGDLAAGETLVRVDPGVSSDSTTFLSGNTINGTLFDTTGGSTGTFTSVGNLSFGATSITSVSDSLSTPGVARFNFTPPPINLYVHQEVVVSGFVTNTAYNGTHIITATASGYFEVESIAFGTTEGGSFLSNTVDLADVATTLVDGDTIVIDTDLSTDYDGSATVYNQQTNTFSVNRTYTSVLTGTWNTAGLDQTNPAVLANSNPGHAESHTFGFGMAHNYATPTTTADGTYAAIDVGTMTALNEERLKLIDAAACIWEVTSNEPIDIGMNATAWISKSGATEVDYRMALSVDGAIPTFATEPYERMQATNDATQVIMELFKSDLVKGQTVQPMFAGDGNTNAMTFEDFTVKWTI